MSALTRCQRRLRRLRLNTLFQLRSHGGLGDSKITVDANDIPVEVVIALADIAEYDPYIRLSAME